MGIPGAGATDQCAAAKLGGWRRAKPIQVSTPGITITTHPCRQPNPMHTPAHHHQPPQAERADGIKKKAPRGQRRGDRYTLSPLEQKTPIKLYKLSKLLKKRRKVYKVIQQELFHETDIFPDNFLKVAKIM